MWKIGAMVSEEVINEVVGAVVEGWKWPYILENKVYSHL